MMYRFVLAIIGKSTGSRMWQMMYGFLLIMSIFIFIVNSVFAQATYEDLEVQFPVVSGEERARTRPGGINGQDVESLLKFMGFRLTQEGDERMVQRLQGLKAQKFGSMAGHQIKNFHIEALIFYAAIGASMFRTAYTDSLLKGGRGDPIWVENLLHEMTSPVGLFSFFCFVMVSGQTNVLYSKLLTGVEFKRGPFKGRRIRGMMEPAVIRDKLAKSRERAIHNIAVGAGSGAATAYTVKRSSVRVASALGGPLGMSMGMLASNIIHEIDYAMSISPHFTPCRESLMGEVEPSASETATSNYNLHCDLFYAESWNTIKTWGPGLVSLVSASFLSHALVNTIYAGGFAGARKIRSVNIKSSFLRGVKVQAKSRIAVGALIRVAVALVPNPISKKARMVGWAVKGAAQWAGRLFLPGGWGFRFLNLYAFMEMEALVTHKVTNWLWTGPMKAGAVSDSIRDFTKYHYVNEDTPALNCKDGSSDCKYHDSILSAHKVAIQFDGWRQYKMQMPIMAHQNWFQYVSNALGAVKVTKHVYRLLFEAKETGNTPFNKVVYFNDHDDLEFINSSETASDSPNKIKKVFNNILQIIEQHLSEEGVVEPEGLSLKVVSDSPSRFLKPIEKLNVRSKDRIFVLRGLFSAVDPQVPLDQFYDDWDQIFNKEKEREKEIKERLRRDIEHLYSSGKDYSRYQYIVDELDNIKPELVAESHLRKRVLAAGVEYLNQIIEIEKLRRLRHLSWRGYQKATEELNGFPTKVQNASRLLYGTGEAVFAELYKETFIKQPHSDAVEYIQIVSWPKGMYSVNNLNFAYKNLEEVYNMNSHPDRIEYLITPNVIDFIVASALCGPDLSQDRGLSEEDIQDMIKKENIGTLMDKVPVFSGSVFDGTSYAFSPPRIVNMDEKFRKAICQGVYKKPSVSPGHLVENIYDDYFPVQIGQSDGVLTTGTPDSEGAYSNLLHLVLDHVGLKGVSSGEGFDHWWNEKMQPYVRLFEEAANQEYKTIVATGFIDPLFQNEMEKEVVDFSSDSSDQSVNEILNFSKAEGEVINKGGFVKEVNTEVYGSVMGTAMAVSPYNAQHLLDDGGSYSFYLPAGSFHNMSFEVRYWSDMIIHFVQKQTRESSSSISPEDLKELKSTLSSFAEKLQPPKLCSSGDILFCQRWLKEVLKAKQEGDQIVGSDMQELLRNITVLLNIDPDNFHLDEHDAEGLSEEKLKQIRRNAISVFSCDSNKPTPKGEPCAPASLLQQLLNYSFLRLKQILETAVHYAQYIEYISEQVPAGPVTNR